jgi:hypothetical protein
MVVGMRRFVQGSRFLILMACTVSAALVCLVGVQLTARADPPPEPAPPPGEQPPEAVLMKGEKALHRGLLGTHCWGYICADRLTFPNPATTARTAPGSILHARIKYARQPTSVSLHATKSLHRRGWLVDPRPLSFTLEPVVAEGQTVAWDAFFSVGPRPDRDYYLSFSGQWEGEGDLHWGFHLKTRRG